MTEPGLLAPEQAAAFLGVTPSTLARWRVHGTGPRHVKLGTGRAAAVRYRESELVAWVDANTASRSSDADASAATASAVL